MNDNDEYTFINKDELEEHKDSEVPSVKKSEILDLKSGSEKRNQKNLKKDMHEKLTPLIEKMEEVNDEILWEMDEIMNNVIEGKGTYNESRFDSLDVLSDIIAHHKVIHDNIGSMEKIIKKL
jgi:hypothetical protein